ncbi:hypothetical protein DC522_10280 [Microvirga sp. KLBC 81]|nr:hypothetical protein DC522_10280 [Microvirga sp. KLBC 81]
MRETLASQAAGQNPSGKHGSTDQASTDVLKDDGQDFVRSAIHCDKVASMMFRGKFESVNVDLRAGTKRMVLRRHILAAPPTEAMGSYPKLASSPVFTTKSLPGATIVRLAVSPSL